MLIWSAEDDPAEETAAESPAAVASEDTTDE